MVRFLDNRWLSRWGNAQALIGLVAFLYGLAQALGAIEGSDALTLFVILVGVVVVATSFLWHGERPSTSQGSVDRQRSDRLGRR